MRTFCDWHQCDSEAVVQLLAVPDGGEVEQEPLRRFFEDDHKIRGANLSGDLSAAAHAV